MPRRSLRDDQKYQAVMDLLGGGSLSDMQPLWHQPDLSVPLTLPRAGSGGRVGKEQEGQPRTREERLDSELSNAKQMIGDQAIAIKAFKKTGIDRHIIDVMVSAGVPFRRQAQVLDVACQILHARYTRAARGGTGWRKQPDDPGLLAWIAELKTVHSSWGIRRVRAFIRKHTGLILRRKRTARIMREQGLLCSRIAKRVHRNTKQRLIATRMNQFWATDMTSSMHMVAWMPTITTGTPMHRK